MHSTVNYTELDTKLECGPLPNLMVALPNKVAPSVQRRKV